MTPLELYNDSLARQHYKPDPQQQQAVLELQRVYDELKTIQAKENWSQRITAKFKKSRQKPVKGVYLWGGVGIGKTWLMDIFYQTLPAANKMRLHFHRFMQQVHHELKNLQGQPDPLKKVAQHFC